MNKIAPQGDRVLIQIIEPGERTAGGLYIPEKARDNQRDAIQARVLAVGPGRVTEFGARLEVTVREGDVVLIPRIAGAAVEHEGGTKMRLIQCVEILATVEEPRIVGLS
jgi:chaperonin GroES